MAFALSIIKNHLPSSKQILMAAVGCGRKLPESNLWTVTREPVSETAEEGP
jgi:hypothetical protein